MFELNNAPDSICLIDVREKYEYEDFNIGGINIPLYELIDRVTEIPETNTLVFCCSSNQRSKLAVEIITPYFKSNILYLKDGVLAI
ncbi:MAG: rhodanese-like domain-containing protein [Pedobacter sp.]|nr:rhodanese-like domain-containing protein [Pedobacter sp.]